MTDTSVNEQALEAAAAAIRNEDGCGLSVDGEHVFCDDPRLEGKEDGYGKPLRHESCMCKSSARAAVEAYNRATRLPSDIGGLVERLHDEADLADNAVIADGATMREAASLIERLSRQEGEPVAWRWRLLREDGSPASTWGVAASLEAAKDIPRLNWRDGMPEPKIEIVPLYAHPSPPEGSGEAHGIDPIYWARLMRGEHLNDDFLKGAHGEGSVTVPVDRAAVLEEAAMIAVLHRGSIRETGEIGDAKAQIAAEIIDAIRALSASPAVSLQTKIEGA